ncbi:sigma-70 family RNA polymerase sigma factor [Solirubrobacter phytolaccae]|uniref:Sigma-70 family RNA polymerase sigma factor n=1 Tax=Solirubrobacter phytolaccae TaxID=1404360 RepID=A0A9X3N568_9ACTN|nr:sigma-70 family RNA polymerase sigma factor [Solirubrobacter phytolaccae]MDA0179849.1 sigma-70 family RNA polymerase sigma factor [Solirubrobacter phytolaccae]
MSDTDAQALRALTLATRTAVAILGPGDQAREVAQEVAIRVLERRTQLRDPDKFDAWVHRIALRETFRAQRGTRRRRAAEATLDDTALELPAPATDHAGQLDAAAASRLALQRLGERERMAMVLRYVHDLPDSQIAAVLDCRRGTVNSLISRARTRLRAMPDLERLTTAGEPR